MWFAPHVAVVKGEPVDAISAEGSSLIHYGFKIVNLVARDSTDKAVYLMIRYEILNVKGVIMSCGLARKHG
eukprot:11398912-Heterocapsa_arctica.AAC.1